MQCCMLMYNKGSDGCYLGELRGTSPHNGPAFLDAAVIADIRSRVAQLSISEHRRKFPPVYSISEEELKREPVRQCSQQVMKLWQEHGAKQGLPAALREQMEENRKSMWTCHAQRALALAAKAFRLVDIPFIPSDGTALGWWRGTMHACTYGHST